MTPFLTVVFGVLFGIAATCLAYLWVTTGHNYAASVLPGQRWKVKGLGIVTIKETLSGGKYYKKYGSGTNVAYITAAGKIGHCSKYAITQNGTLVKRMANVSFVSDEWGDSEAKEVQTYDRRGRIVTGRPKETIDAEFCDPEAQAVASNVYQLLPKKQRR